MQNKRVTAQKKELRRRIAVAKRVVQWVRDDYPDWSHADLNNYMAFNNASCEMVHAEFDRRLRAEGSPKIWKASVRRRLRKSNS